MAGSAPHRVDQWRLRALLPILLLCGHLTDARPGVITFSTRLPCEHTPAPTTDIRDGLVGLVDSNPAPVATAPVVPDDHAVRLLQAEQAGSKSVHRPQADTVQSLQINKRTIRQRALKQMLLDMPGDPTAGEVILQHLDSWWLQPFGIGNSPFSRFDSTSSGPSTRKAYDSDSSMPTRSSRGSASLTMRIGFEPVAAFNTSIRLPLLPRTFDITLVKDSDRIVCATGLIYREQEVQCGGLDTGLYTIVASDTDFGDMQLAEKEVQVQLQVPSSGVEFTIQLGMLLLEASFGSLAWPGVYARTSMAPLGSAIHAQIVGAQVVVYAKDQPDQIWDMQWTGDEGTAPFFLVPGSSSFVANMSVGDTLLQSQPVQFIPDRSYLSRTSMSQPQVVELVAQQQLLCTGEVEDVRGEWGTFPANIQQLEASGLTVFHPRGFFCRWELVPDYPELTLTVNYAGLLHDESLMLYLGPNNIIRLEKPGKEDSGGVFQSTIWVERSIFVEFQTTSESTSAVGAFTVSWTSSGSDSKGLLTNRAMVVVLGCVSAAGAILAALCFYCVCCSRRRRGVVVVNGGTVADRVALLRVPSAVRELLPSKPYQPPEDNPLPGAATEPDCCSICLVEFEAAEHVTVLPCMHFYHKDCINSWLQRNCTCPLCKCNVLLAFQRTAQQQGLEPQQRRHRHRHRRSHQNSSRRGSSSSSGDDDQTTSVAVTLPGSPAVEPELSTGNGLQQSLQSMSTQMLATPAAAVTDVGSGMAHVLGSSTQPSRLPPLPALRVAGAAADAPPALVTSVPEGARALRTPSPAGSIRNPPSGTVVCDEEDFAAAAAAAAAALAAETADEQASTAAGALNGAYEAAQASVSAVRASSRVWGRRLHGFLQPASNDAGAPAEQQHVVELRQVSAQRLQAAAVGSTPSVAASPEVVLHVPRRGAIKIYAYAGHPTAVDGEHMDEGGEVPVQLGNHHQQHLQTCEEAVPAPAASVARASSSSDSSSTGDMTNADDSSSSRRQGAGLPGVAE